ncbi:MAG: adenylate/guanylate cyclase domain-containing protein [Treponema sp.]|uniref:adenylate/guanylate cyclase domain-containing protein n=1 Tax=Treponema sp. TaxID=166 RepID=UPI002A90A517|nr:adenylate/guanylate cyclase domain-containing protein [Treponema sp.]MDY6398978.1 adenylate/guanylate cyclase domain-containing protein [Treponema sp.]
MQKSLDYGDFVPAKKKFSQKIDETQGSFVRVNPNVTKLSIDGDKITIISKLSPIVQKNEPAVAESEALPESEQIKITGGEDFTFETPDESVPHRSDEIKKFLADDRRSLKLKKNAFNLLQKYENRERIEDEKASRVKQPIGVKLVVIISFLLILAVGGVTYAVSYFVSQDTRSNAEENNLAINSRTASDTENRINSAVSSVTMFLDLMTGAVKDDESAKEIEKLFFDRNRDIVAVYYSRAESGVLLASNKFLVTHEIEKENVLAYIQQESESSEKAKNGSFEILNATPFFNSPLISLFCPASSSSGEGFVAFLYSTAGIGESFASGSINQSFLVNNDGIVLIHSDFEKMNSAADLSSLKIVQEMLSSPGNNGQLPYKDENGDEYIGAFHKLGIGSGGVITVVKTSVILEGVKRITYRNICIMFAVVALAILIIYFFAKSLSKPLQALTEVVNEVNKGNFNTRLFDELKLKRKDEIGVLERSTKNEREILNMVSRLTNTGVTKAVITKKIDFDPHLKDITIFFSDIRGFTAISDGFKKRFGEHSAAEIIGFLNDYMSRMVTCINKTGGIVDKFEGDAIMAVWGVLRTDNLDWEKMSENSVTRLLKEEAHREYVKADALSAVTCCIAMRYSLMKYNKDAAAFTEAHKNDPLAKYKPHIRIGAGLNSGRATVGFMGSFDKMEFTSIGDSVNFASRAEASNKPCGTDILITQDTYDILKKDFIRCEENNFIIKPANIYNEIIVEKIPVEFEVKGKGKQHFYGVVNMPNFDIEKFFSTENEKYEVDVDCERAVGPAGPKTLKEVRELLGIDTPDFEKVNLDAEENKIQVAAP